MDNSIVILPADKGNAVVVMNRTEYVKKMTRLLENETYTSVSKHIREKPLEEDDRFDIVSLFTNVPINEALEAISPLLRDDESLEDKTAIPAVEICRLTELCLPSTYFQFQDLFYEQKDGAAMGSPLSPVVTNLYMEACENRALQLAPLQPRMWVRYVDDTFVLWPHGKEELESFHNLLNSIPSIQFTREEEEGGSLSFLDVKLTKEGGKILTGVHKKSTHTDRYIQFSSHHHPHIMTGVVCCLKRRADSICDEHSLKPEVQHLQRTFEAN